MVNILPVLASLQMIYTVNLYDDEDDDDDDDDDGDSVTI